MCTTTVTITDANGVSNSPSEDASISFVKKIPARELHRFRPTSCHFSLLHLPSRLPLRYYWEAATSRLAERDVVVSTDSFFYSPVFELEANQRRNKQRWLEPKALSCRWHFEQGVQKHRGRRIWRGKCILCEWARTCSLSSHRVANLAMSPPPSAADYPAHQSRAVTGPTFNDI
ncbi:hypothetical protein GE21DRAFT_6953 [Neurospora crassa]|uniref:Uncharacterized protein n=2 Tax=Neurospora crassa TaxID=5141 RepID=Q1K674_NEUCR|nr:hypothetical protein NCU08912 [Neurospora crassa OR74A]EAA29445.1 hypothetical protein NCU08912 [Neurospora crassa OR74A]KHE83887.1 hypothetical protein GE21DRAFT_6953 [Neurospora crassa]CAD70751.1 hypothetical protein [Neurospora crassa]|eukprot:XP_958681.1 hypothetical protein NCU08912 [Neurospora crassa OR74A]